MPIKFTVLGNPRPQKRVRASKVGNFIRFHDASAKDKGSFALVAQQEAPDEPLKGPLEVVIRFYFDRPKGDFGSGRNEGKLKALAPKCHAKKPDLDNLAKLVLDALNKIMWKDDSQICSLVAMKFYDPKPRTEIEIIELEN